VPVVDWTDAAYETDMLSPYPKGMRKKNKKVVL
jgi:hypothetical protein